MNTLFCVMGAKLKMSRSPNIMRVACILAAFARSMVLHKAYSRECGVGMKDKVAFEKERFQYKPKIKNVSIESTTLILNYTIYVLKQKFNLIQVNKVYEFLQTPQASNLFILITFDVPVLIKGFRKTSSIVANQIFELLTAYC